MYILLHISISSISPTTEKKYASVVSQSDGEYPPLRLVTVIIRVYCIHDS